MKILARHKWVSGAIITESVDTNKGNKDTSYRRFTATIRGWRNWRIFEGYLKENTAQIVMNKVREIRDKIDNGDEKVFLEYQLNRLDIV